MPGNCPNVVVNELQNNLSTYVVAYPNPSDELISVFSEHPINKIEIFDIRGALVFSREFCRQQLVSIDVDKFSGIFTIKVFLENDVILNNKLISY